MHYKDGTEAKLGDTAKFPLSIWDPATNKAGSIEGQGIVVAIQPSAGSCNAMLVYPLYESQSPFGGETPFIPRVSLVPYTVTLSECELVKRG